MENVMTKGFCELSENEMMDLDGGGWKEAGYAFAVTVLVGISPAGGVASGVFGTPVAGVAAGFGVASVGFYFLDKACG